MDALGPLKRVNGLLLKMVILIVSSMLMKMDVLGLLKRVIPRHKMVSSNALSMLTKTGVLGLPKHVSLLQKMVI